MVSCILMGFIRYYGMIINLIFKIAIFCCDLISGVTHENLQKLAIKAFGWTMLNEYQLIQAQKDFPKLTY